MPYPTGERWHQTHPKGTAPAVAASAQLPRIWSVETNRKRSEALSGSRAYQWKGGRQIDDKGYVRIYTRRGVYRYEHRVVMERIIGRLLTRSEQVHHIDGNKQNNSPDNLMFFPNAAAHSRFHKLAEQT